MGSLAAEERRDWLVTELRASQSVSLAGAASALGVSEMTVRRDLNELQAAGVARRVRGGAVFLGPVSFQGRDRSHDAEKRVIAQKLLPLVPAEGVIAFDSSTTIHRLAELVTGEGRLTIVTNGLLTFQALLHRPGIVAILTGGTADERSDSLVGPVTTSALETMRFSAFFGSVAAIDARSTYEDTFEEAEVKRAFARAAARIVVGAHAEKLDAAATAAAIPTDNVATLATDLDSAAHELSPFRSHVTDVR